MTFHFTCRRFAAISAAFFAALACVEAADPASDLAAALRAKEEGSTFIRVRMQSGSAENQILQLQIKSRVSDAISDIVYQVLFPKERKGEAVLLHRSGEKIG